MKIDTDTQIRCIVNTLERGIEDLKGNFGVRHFTGEMENAVRGIEFELASFREIWARNREQRGNL